MTPYSATKGRGDRAYQIARKRIGYRRHLRERGLARSHPDANLDQLTQEQIDYMTDKIPMNVQASRGNRLCGSFSGQQRVLLRHRPMLRRERRARDVLINSANRLADSLVAVAFYCCSS